MSSQTMTGQVGTNRPSSRQACLAPRHSLLDFFPDLVYCDRASHSFFESVMRDWPWRDEREDDARDASKLIYDVRDARANADEFVVGISWAC